VVVGVLMIRKLTLPALRDALTWLSQRMDAIALD
jgi:hypothetical protein